MKATLLAGTALIALASCGFVQAQETKGEGAIPPGLRPLEVPTEKAATAAIKISKPMPSQLALKHRPTASGAYSLATDKLVIRGALANDRADGSPGGMAYLAATPGVFLAQIFVHALIQGSINDNRLKAAQTEADKVVIPFQLTSETWAKSEMLAGAYGLLSKESSDGKTSNQSTARDDKQLDFLFTLSQDQKSWSVDLFIAGNDDKAATSKATAIAVRAVAPMLGSEETSDALMAENGLALKNKLIGLLSEALVLSSMHQNANEHATLKEQTLRYQDGNTLRIERGILLSEDCDRVIFKGLRKVIVSAPKVSTSADCKP
jgi:hypothetical protein